MKKIDLDLDVYNVISSIEKDENDNDAILYLRGAMTDDEIEVTGHLLGDSEDIIQMIIGLMGQNEDFKAIIKRAALDYSIENEN